MSTVVSKRLRRLRGRKDLHTSQVPVPPLPAPRQSPNDSGQPQLPPGGALAYLADYDVHRAKIYGRCEAMTGIASFTALVEQVMTQEPYVSADGVFWVVNNGSSHRGQKGIDRVAEQFPNAVMVHTPVHASWLNQVKVYLSIIQRKALSPPRLHRPRHCRATPHPIRGQLHRSGQTPQMEVHHQRPCALLERLDRQREAQTPGDADPVAVCSPTNLRT